MSLCWIWNFSLSITILSEYENLSLFIYYDFILSQKTEIHSIQALSFSCKDMTKFQIRIFMNLCCFFKVLFCFYFISYIIISCFWFIVCRVSLISYHIISYNDITNRPDFRDSRVYSDTVCTKILSLPPVTLQTLVDYVVPGN